MSLFVKGLTYSDFSPTVSVIHAWGHHSVTVEDSSFLLRTDYNALVAAGYQVTSIFAGLDVNLTVSASNFSSWSGSAVGTAISCYGGTIRDCSFENQFSDWEVSLGVLGVLHRHTPYGTRLVNGRSFSHR